MVQVANYQAVLNKLSTLPAEYIIEVEKFLDLLKAKSKENMDAKARTKITMSLAGAWSDMSETEFQSLLEYFKETKKEMFNCH